MFAGDIGSPNPPVCGSYPGSKYQIVMESLRWGTAMARSQQQVIAGLMDRLDPLVESPSMTGMSTMMGGGSASTPDDSTLDVDGESTTVILSEPEEAEDDGHFNPTQLKIAKRFIDLMGGADKARAAIDKVDEGEEFLGLIDDDDVRQDSDSSMISQMAGMLPGTPDLPMELSNLYNPAAGGGSM